MDWMDWFLISIHAYKILINVSLHACDKNIIICIHIISFFMYNLYHIMLTLIDFFLMYLINMYQSSKILESE